MARMNPERERERELGLDQQIDGSKVEMQSLIDCLEAFSQSQTNDDHDDDEERDSSIPLQYQRISAQELADELLALQSIYTEENISLLNLTNNSNNSNRRYQTTSTSLTPPLPWTPDSRIRLSLTVQLDSLLDSSESDSSCIRLAITLPPHYPSSTFPPQFQLLSKYVGSYSVDSTLFGQILRLFHHGSTNQEEVHWIKGQVILFEGIEKAREKIEDWLKEKKENDESDYKDQQALYANGKGTIKPNSNDRAMTSDQTELETQRLIEINQKEASENSERLKKQAEKIERMLVTAPPITEKKSVFIGHACKIESIEDVSFPFYITYSKVCLVENSEE